MSKENAIVLREMARYIRKHGFSYELGDHGGPRCFVGACDSSTNANYAIAIQVVGDGAFTTEMSLPVDSEVLRDQGWNTDDAAAACEIAADLETP